jgi:hypothetical protein
MLTETMVAEGDSLVMFYVDFGPYYDEPFYLAKFDKTSAAIKSGETLTLTLSVALVDIWTMAPNPYLPLGGATLFACDALNRPVNLNASTGADGQATLTFPAAGTYTVSAKRAGANNATELIPPLCQVTVSPNTPPDPNNTITVYFSLQGLNSGNGREETWINRKTVANLAAGATVADVIIKALEGSGYTQSGAQNGYIGYITRPNGTKLAEFDYGPNSGWKYKINSVAPKAGIDSYTVKSGDHVLLYFTKDWTQEEDAADLAGRQPGRANNTVIGESALPLSGLSGAWVNPFSDVPPGHWAAPYIYSLAERGIIKGKTATLFAPGDSLTRAELVTILYRYEGEAELNHPGAGATPPKEGNNHFSDVPAGQWYTNAIMWAAEKGIITGYDNGLFGINNSVTREQFAAILYRYAQSKGLDTSPSADLAGYSDAGQISAYAAAAMKWAKATELINGRTSSTLAPKGKATRAEAATLLMRFIELTEK